MHEPCGESHVCKPEGEAWGILQALEFVGSIGLQHVVFDSDSKCEFVNNQKTRKKTIMRLTYQALKHLINERQGKMIFSGYLVQPPIINADSPAVLHSCGDELIPFILNHCEACLLWNHLDWTHPLVVRNWVDDSSL